MIWILLLLFAMTNGEPVVSDMSHMQSCVSCARDTVSSGHDLIDRLTNQADGRIETVILYLLRACYFRVDRYQASCQVPDILKHAQSSVPSFTDHEFTLLNEITRIEAYSYLNSKSQSESPISNEWEVQFSVALVACLTLPLFLWRIKTYRTVT